MNYLEELSNTIDALDMMRLFELENFVRACQGTLWLAGNGGSAATAQHWACDLSKKAGRRVQALGCNPAVLTAWANDARYEDALALEFDRLYRFDGDDAVLALSCSGSSPNIKRLMERASEHGLATMLVTSANFAGHWSNVVSVPHVHYGIIEDCHLAIGHWLTEALCSR